MRRVMEELDIPSPELHSGAVWAAVINLVYCSISLNELIRRAKISRKKRTNFSAKMFFKVVDRVAETEKKLGIYDLAQFTPKT
ncbi:MAG: hypothetical protein DMF01_01640 [Verrucomicrobia bacterium]|nr:MAG: hypothetical protein DMF01_01640 [Verrucomicrobiota bacterium]